MKAYGLPRDKSLEFPDVGDIRHFALKTSAGRVQGHKHAGHSYTRSAEHRGAVRRYWKKRLRRHTKNSINKEIEYLTRAPGSV